MKKWELIKSEMALDERWYKVRRDTVKLPNGRIMDDYFLGLRGKYAQMVPFFENGDVLMVKQYKHGFGDFTIELPAGMVGEGEDPLACARRELEEETGYSGENWRPLGVVHENPTKSVNQSFWYVATGLKKSGEQHLDDSEEIEIIKIHYKKLIEMIRSGEVITGPTIGSFMLALLELGYLKTV
jgi:8-oxo-dGTP pyrophosphatase MutT (NUDIX family)